MKEATKIWILLARTNSKRYSFKILVFSGLTSSGFWQMPGLALSFLLTSMRSLDKSGRRLNFTLSNKSALRPLLTYDQTDEKSWMLSIGNNCLVAQFWTLLVGNAAGGQTMKTCLKTKTEWRCGGGKSKNAKATIETAVNKTTVALSINFITHQTQTQTQPTKCFMLLQRIVFLLV